ncbi:SDR family oxidoreductase [Acidisphaera sp. L21]|uniref:SDR family NAD(P)-dependent oxidoreductase n=1 Tax=Acidisphaera sp. L21 TaxID=1641851 RepID=UPI00131A9EB5|nr:SDR family NAD(P)-dependent oxidoreductase [Acidisphaera sp. L21]
MPASAPCALITGASAGIGLCYAEHLARAGHDLVIVARRGEILNKHAKRLEEAHGVDVEVLTADLEQTIDVARVAERIETGGRIDVFINSAGYAVRGRVDALDPIAMEAMLKVNIIAMSRLSHSAMSRMRAEGSGRIVNIASATCFILIPANAGYGASKNYVMAFTRHMQVEAEGTGIQVQLLVPGVVATDFHSKAGGSLSAFSAERIMSADSLVVASLRALEMGESICIPSLPSITSWDAYIESEHLIAKDVSHAQSAARYH